MRLGIFGGTFNPVHLGHLRAAQEVLEEMGLDRILLIPSYQPPHKSESEVVSSDHRLEMVRAATADNPAMEASSLEVERGGPSYTHQTLLQIREQLGSGSPPYFIAGADAALEIETWHRYKELFKLARFIILSRPGQAERKAVFSHLLRILPDAYGAGIAPHTLSGSGRYQDVRYFSCTKMDISSTNIRSLARSGKSLRYLVPSSVDDYIQKRKIYS
ncbi:MAG: nicotinate-nucleotide adenylyltransferase [Desulfatibacillaceae bacterium]